MEKLLGLPVLASEHGKHVDNLIIYVHWLMIVLFVGWLAYFAYTLFRFHRSRNPKADYVGVKSHASTYIEGAVAIVEGVLLVDEESLLRNVLEQAESKCRRGNAENDVVGLLGQRETGLGRAELRARERRQQHLGSEQARGQAEASRPDPGD